MTLKQLKKANRGKQLLGFEIDYWNDKTGEIVTLEQHATTEKQFLQLLRDKGLANSTYRRIPN